MDSVPQSPDDRELVELMAKDDWDLVELIAKQGDQEAFGEIYRRYQRTVYYFLISLCKDQTVAEDLTQQTFLEFFLHLEATGTYHRTSLRAWLYKIAKGLAFARYRSKEFSSATADGIPFGILEDSAEDAFDQLEHFESLICQLPDQQALVIRLIFFDDLSNNRVAELLELSPGRISQIKQAALDTLKRMHEKELAGPDFEAKVSIDELE